MKKANLLIAILFTLTCLYGCDMENTTNDKTDSNQDNIINETESVLTELDTTNNTLDHENIPYISYDMEKFINDVISSSNDKTNVMFSMQEVSDILVPIVVSADYVFSFAEVNEYNMIFYYVPKDYSEAYFDYSDGIVVSVSKEPGSFEATMKQHDLTSQDGMAIDISRNRIYLNNNGYRIGISFPADITITKAEQLNEYFKFEPIDQLK